MRLASARHCDGVFQVFQAIICLVLNRLPGVDLLEVRCKAAALVHEVLDHTMKDRAVISAGIHVRQKVLNRFRGFVGI